jgi:hypothetical protein
MLSIRMTLAIAPGFFSLGRFAQFTIRNAAKDSESDIRMITARKKKINE